MQKIYRYEILLDNKYIGPYMAVDYDHKLGQLSDKITDDHNIHDDTHPIIGEDMIGLHTLHVYCACPDLKTLKTWFRGYNTILRKYGFNLVEYTVNKTLPTFSGLQVGFYMKDVVSKKILQ